MERGQAMGEYKIYKYRWGILAIYMYLSALPQLYWLNFAAIDTFLEERFSIPASSVMWFTLVFPLVQVLLTMPAGMIIDKKGFKYGVGIGALFTGMMIGLGATPALVQSLGYETMLIIYGAMGILGILLFFSLVKTNPATPPREIEVHQEITGWQGIKHILKMRDFVILGFIAMIGIGVFNGLATWLEKMLNELHQIAMTDAGTISAVLILSGMIGCIIIPMVSEDRKSTRLNSSHGYISYAVFC